LIELALPRIASVDIAAVAGRLAELRRQAQRRRYAGPTPQLPSRHSILAMTDDLLAIIYPRHLGGHDLSNDDLDSFVAHALEKVLPVLEREVALEISLSGGGEAARLNAVDAAQIAAEFVDALPSIRERVDLDIRAALAADPAQGSFDEMVFCSVGVAAILRHRLAHQLYLLGAPLTAKIIASDWVAKTGIDIHPGAEIGEGFFIANAGGLTIGETTIIGKHVRLQAPVTLGESFAIETGPEVDAGGMVTLSSARVVKSATGAARRHPCVEDDVVIEAGASVFGPVTIGRGSTIGRNARVLRDVTPYSRIDAGGA
jgi:serine O-acetyltransferase